MQKDCQESWKSGILAIGNRLRTPTQGWTPHKDPEEYTPTCLSLGVGLTHYYIQRISFEPLIHL